MNTPTAPAPSLTGDIRIDCAFDAGNIEVLSITGAEASLAIRPDAGSDFRQWFHFRVSNARGRTLVLRLTGLNASAYPGGWPGYRAILAQRTPDFQTRRGYPTARPGKANLSMATNQIAQPLAPWP